MPINKFPFDTVSTLICRSKFIGYIFLAILLSISLPGNCDASTAKLKLGVYKPNSIGVGVKDLKIGLEVWITEIGRSNGIESEIFYYDDPKELAEAFKEGRINMSVANPLVYVQYFDTSLLLPGVVGYSSSKKDASKLLLLVRNEDRDKPMRAFLKKLISIPRYAEESRLLLETISMKNGCIYEPSFSLTKNSQLAILQLFFKKSDMAVVSLPDYKVAVELNPQLKTKLSIYKTFDIFVGDLTYMRKGMDMKFYNTIVENAKNLFKTPRGRQVMLMFHVDTVDLCYTEDLKNIRELYLQYMKLKSEKDTNDL